MSKLLALCSALFVSSLAHASFELTFVLDNAGTGNVQVKRFDPNTGAFLGAFGRGIIQNPPYGLALDQATNTCYVTTFSGAVQRFNMYTGEFMGEYALSVGSTGWTSVSLGGNLLRSIGSSIGIFASTGLLNSSFGGGLGANYQSVVQAANGNYYALDGTLNRLYSFSSTGTYLSYMSINSAYSFNDLKTYGNKVIWSTTDFNVANNDRIYSVDTVAGGAGNYRVWNPGVPTYTLRGASLGHDNVVHYSYINSSSQAVIGSMSINTGTVYGTFGAGSLSFALSQQTVNTPEPGTWAALGLGALAILRRRSR